MNETTREQIIELMSGFMQNIIKRRIEIEPFRSDEIEKVNPFGFRLVPIEIWKGSKFERSFVTSLGQKVFEQLARIIAEGTGAYVRNQYSQEIILNSYREEKIFEILSMNRSSTRVPNWDLDVNDILSLHNQKVLPKRVIFDLYIKRNEGLEEYYSIKTVKPNLDQTEIAKRDMLFIKSAQEECETYFALPYNPAGEGGDYRKIHSIPYKIFDMDKDECVLIGSAFWNKVGHDNQTYSELLDIFEEVGGRFEYQIRRDYLGLV